MTEKKARLTNERIRADEEGEREREGEKDNEEHLLEQIIQWRTGEIQQN